MISIPKLVKSTIFSNGKNQFIRCVQSSSTMNVGVSTNSDLLSERQWTPDSKRTGVLAMKVGMMPVWDKWGYRHNCTVLKVEDCHVIQVKTQDSDGYTALQLGAGIRKENNIKKPQLGELKKAGLNGKISIQEFRITPDAIIPSGTQLHATHFSAGQMVDVCGTSIGKGFQGVMKRHNFAGQPASHGNSKTHRHLGSTGQCQDPGRVFKGKKMPGRMGNARVTRDNLLVCKIDPIRNLLYVKGSVPGNKGGIIRVTDARKKKLSNPPAFPTFELPENVEDIPIERLVYNSEEDPYTLD